jgi:hypothetical protein
MDPKCRLYWYLIEFIEFIGLEFGPRLTLKAIPDAVKGSNFGKTIFSKYKGFIYDVEKKIILA